MKQNHNICLARCYYALGLILLLLTAYLAEVRWVSDMQPVYEFYALCTALSIAMFIIGSRLWPSRAAQC